MSFLKIRTALGGLLLSALVACGGGGGGSDAGTAVLPGTGSGAGGGSGGATVPTVTLTVQLLDAAGQATTAIVVGQPVRAQAVLKKNGQVVSAEIVQFATDQSTLVKIDPIAGSQLTDTSGLATVTVSSLGAGAGAGRISATATVGGVAATGAANFFASGSVGTQPTTLTLSGLEIGSGAVSAYGTTGVRVRVLQGTTPYTSAVTVNFTTSCAAGKATITPSATTQPDGYAVATFVDNGCAQTADSVVTITASIGTDSKSGSMTVKAPTSGSLRFVSAAPSDKSITLRGQGGNGRQENAALTFKLVDVAGNGVSDADICFDVTTYVGGLNLDGFSTTKLPNPQGSATLCGALPDDKLSIVRYVKRTSADGSVSVQINSGTVPTSVRVRARALYPATAAAPLETFSDTLSISTGLPLQRSFSLSVDKANIDGGNFDGEKATLTIRLADQFSNPVPDGTVVNFIASGAAVCTADNGSCKTTNGACSCDFVSQARRPLDGRVVVMAYAVGLEDFNDNNGNNVYDAGDGFIDPSKPPLFNYDLGDAYVDSNKNGLPGDAKLDAATGKLIDTKVNTPINGDSDVLIPYQNGSAFAANGDGARGTAHLRASTVIYLSQASTAGDPTVVVPTAQLSQQRNLLTDVSASKFLRLDPVCPQGTPLPQATLALVLEDGIGNPMASGTSLTVADSSDNIAAAGFRPASVLAFGARSPNPLIDLPNLAKPNTWSVAGANGTVVSPHSVTVRGVADKCSGSGSFALEVASPRGGKATARVLYDGESRLNSRFAFGIRYVVSAFDMQLVPSSLMATIATADFVGRSDVSKYSIDWGDGASPMVSLLPVLAARAHAYRVAGTYTVTMNLQRVAQTNKEISEAASMSEVVLDPILFSTMATGGGFTIDWGDGSLFITGTKPPASGQLTKRYTTPGHYTVRVAVDETVQSTSQVVNVPP